jgi:hypothetical protein
MTSCAGTELSCWATAGLQQEVTRRDAIVVVHRLRKAIMDRKWS